MSLCDQQGEEFARALINYPHEEVARVQVRPSSPRSSSLLWMCVRVPERGTDSKDCARDPAFAARHGSHTGLCCAVAVQGLSSTASTVCPPFRLLPACLPACLALHT